MSINIRSDEEIASGARLISRYSLPIIPVALSLFLYSHSPCLEAKEAPVREISLKLLVDLAIHQSPQLHSHYLREQAFGSDARVAAFWPKATVSTSLLNVPTDSMDLHQEPMTQFQISLVQPLPQGRSIELSSRLQQQQAESERLKRRLLEAEILRRVKRYWVQIQVAHQARMILDQSVKTLGSLQQAVEARYRYASSATQQADLAVLASEQEQLRDQRSLWQQQAEVTRQRLNGYLPTEYWHVELSLSVELDDILTLTAAGFSELDEQVSPLHQVEQHPALLLARQAVKTAETSVELAREKDLPSWRLQAAYGYRGDDASGHDRADFISFGIGAEIPWFSTGQSHYRITAATRRQGAEWSYLEQVQRELGSQVLQWQTEARLLQARLNRLVNHRLPLSQARIEAAEVAYRNDEGSFLHVMQARLAYQKEQLERLILFRSLALAGIQLAYLSNSDRKVTIREGL